MVVGVRLGDRRRCVRCLSLAARTGRGGSPKGTAVSAPRPGAPSTRGSATARWRIDRSTSPLRSPPDRARATARGGTGPRSPPTLQARLHRGDADQVERRLKDFDAKWGGKYDSIATAWQRAWSEFTPFLSFPEAIREIVYITNAIESLNARYRRAATACGHFPSERAALRVRIES
ncbi:transposase [Streptomyces sp. NPDC087437]|uniref:transposase n=1 Tax=Streptomyces sp. NPDC087437 TaxID=3365789 RepID=UPI003805A7F2